MISFNSIFLKRPEITPLDDDQVQVPLVLPSDLFHDIVKLLGIVTQLATTIRSKNRLHKYSWLANDPAAQARLEYRDQFYLRIVVLYDRYQDQGLKRTAAIKQISMDLRQENHPWAADFLVRSSLVAAGRPGSRRNS